jgi:LuxR family maltose regulon positive regulatory protein
MTGDVQRAKEAATRAVELERGDESPWRAMALAALGRTRFWTGDLVGAEEALGQAVRLSSPSSNNLSVIGALGYLAALRSERGELREAASLADRALAMSEEHGFREHWVCVMALVARARVLQQEGRLGEAGETAAAAVELAARGGVHVEQAYGLVALADVRRGRRREEARRLVRDARALVDRCPDPGRLAEHVARSERRLGLVRRVPHAPVDEGDELSARELAILQLLPSERSLREIGAALFVSHNTVKTHTRGIYRKLRATTRGEAVARARELGLL